MSSKTIFVLILFGICVQSIDAQICSDPFNTIYGVDQFGGIVPIDVNSASVGTPVTSSSDPGYPGSTNNANAIGLNIQNGTFYYFQDNAAGSQQFVSYDPATSTYTLLANSPISGTVVKGCVSADGTGYYCIDGAGKLCYYDIVANAWKLISSNLVDQFSNSLAGTLSALGNGDMAIDGLGNLWIVVASPSKWGLYRIDAPLPITATATVILNEMIAPVKVTPSGLPFVGIAYNATGQIYLSTVDDLYLLENDLSITHINTYNTTGVVVDLTSCNYPLVILPLTWTSFTASLQNNNSVWLHWSVSQQLNEKGYYIERSMDSQHWENVGYQQSSQGEGERVFGFIDASPNNGINYYRIRTLAANGNSKYSEIRIVNISGKGYVNIWPTPASNKVYIQIAGNTNSNRGSASIYNSSGQQVANSSLHGGINTVDINELPVGYYIIHIFLPNGKTISRKLMKVLD
ncbi:MAG: T9SS type A sorting domain-containing protein [Ginsengibacter sp.]